MIRSFSALLFGNARGLIKVQYVRSRKKLKRRVHKNVKWFFLFTWTSCLKIKLTHPKLEGC